MTMKVKLFVMSILTISITMPIFSQISYREKYRDVLAHYSRCEDDSLKLKAALHLIDNMDGHSSPDGYSVKKYISSLATMKKYSGIRELQLEWNRVSSNSPLTYLPDSAIIDDNHLIKYIESAFSSWENAAWKNEIDFNLFCHYVLPYRINDEHLSNDWLGFLRHRYGPLIKGMTSQRKAFAILKKAVFKDVVLSNNYCPFTLDPISCLTVGRAECAQRCILLCAVLRALCIPSAIDVTPMWADYSNKGHAWVSMIVNDGSTYTVFEDDSIAKQYNPIDASRFFPLYQIKDEDHCPYIVKTDKTPVKIYRICYEHCNKVEHDAPPMLSSPFLLDVSHEYGLNATVDLEIKEDGLVYLCAFLSGADWMPVDKAVSKNGKVIFRWVGPGSVCVPAMIKNNKLIFLSPPFLMGENGIIRSFMPSADKKEKIVVNRKYPLCSYITDTWGYMRGGTFEASTLGDFSQIDTLATISVMPSGMTTLKTFSNKKYRFLRYHAPQDNRSSLAELSFISTDTLGQDVLLSGTYFGTGVDSSTIEKAFDDNQATSCKGLQVGYTIGLDLGKGHETSVSKIIFSPSTDLNFVEKEHLYELYYFDTAWHLLERVFSKGNELVFNNVPIGSLLLLKDKTTGVEERIFEYKDNKQIWY